MSHLRAGTLGAGEITVEMPVGRSVESIFLSIQLFGLSSEPSKGMRDLSL